MFSIATEIFTGKKLPAAKLVTLIFCLAIMLFSISLFGQSGLIRALEGLKPDAPAYDFYIWYTAGQLWNEGDNPYDYETFRARFSQLVGEKLVRGATGYYYPPQTTILFSGLAILPAETAYLTFIGFNLICLFVSLGMLALMLSWHRPIGLMEITLLVSLIGTSFGRMNIREGQLGLLGCVLVLGTFILTRYSHNTWAGISLAALSFKPTFAPLYVGYYLLRRSYRLLVACIVAGILFTLLPLVLTQRPVVETMLNWLAMLRFQSGANQVNIDDPSPFTPNSALMSHLTPLVYRLLNAQSGLTTAIAWLTILALVGFTVYLLWKKKSSGPTDLLDFGLVSALSLATIYHRPYDAFLLFPGLLYIYIHAAGMDDKAAKTTWAGFLAIIIALLTLPIDLSTRLSSVYPFLQDYYLWRVIAAFQAWVSLAVLGALLWLKMHQPQEPQGQVKTEVVK